MAWTEEDWVSLSPAFAGGGFYILNTVIATNAKCFHYNRAGGLRDALQGCLAEYLMKAAAWHLPIYLVAGLKMK